MSENPFQSPEESRDAFAKRQASSESRTQLYAIAKYQKTVLLSLLVYLGVTFAFVFISRKGGDVTMIRIVAIPAVLVCVVFTILLATKLYSIPTAVIFGILVFVPCLGLLVLLIINDKATKRLKKHGIRVGLLGANLNEINEVDL